MKSHNNFIVADESKALTFFYHKTGTILIILTPLAFILSPSKLNFPIDLILGIIFPIHSHVALNYVISDYVPKASRTVARASLLGATVIATAGILRLNFKGAGLTESIKSLWRKKKSN